MQVIMKNIVLTAALLTIGMSVYAGDMSNSIELTQLYIVGDATVTSWDLGRADEFHRIDEGVFEWTGHLAGGKEFKFMNSRDGWHKHIVATEAGVEVKKERNICWISMPTGRLTESMIASFRSGRRVNIPSS